MRNIVKVKCSNGHYFNSEQFPQCPICGAPAPESVSNPSIPAERGVSVDNVTPPIQEGVEPPKTFPTPSGINPTSKLMGRAPEPKPATAGKKPEPEIVGGENTTPDAPPEAKPSSLAQAVNATSSTGTSALPKTVAYYNFDAKEPPVGWLICTEGTYQGTAFECKAGKNRIGRSPDMGINLAEDTSITRDTHAILIYDPVSKKFFIQNGIGDGMVHVNGDLLFDHAELHAYDKLTLGKLQFVFLPLCGDQFTWDDYIK